MWSPDSSRKSTSCRDFGNLSGIDDRDIEVGNADLPCHQPVQQRLEEIVQHGAPAAVQIDLAVDSVEDDDDLILLRQIGREGTLKVSTSLGFMVIVPCAEETI